MTSPASLSKVAGRYKARQGLDTRRVRRSHITGDNIEPTKRAIAKERRSQVNAGIAHRKALYAVMFAHYDTYVDAVNSLRADLGLDPIRPKDRESDPPELRAAKARARAISKAYEKTKRQCAHPRVVQRGDVRYCETCGREM